MAESEFGPTRLSLLGLEVLEGIYDRITVHVSFC